MAEKRRILFLASYFPKPGNPLMGTWALAQARAFARREDVELLVVSFTSWVPRILARTPGARAYAECPAEFTWLSGEFPGVRVLYPRWFYWPVGPIRRWMHRRPGPFMRLAAWSARRRFREICEDFKPDAIFCHHVLPNGWLAMEEAGRRGIPWVVTEHDLDEMEDCARLPARHKAFASVARKTDAMIAISHRMAEAIRATSPEAKVMPLPNGVDLPPPDLHRTPPPPELAGKRRILAVALFSERKGIPLLVEAFAKIAPAHPDAVLRIVGSGPDEPRIRDTIARLNLGNRVQMAGRKSPEEVHQEMAWADLFALPSWNEPFGVVYLEALAAGTPILFCSDCGIGDVAEDGVHGFVVPPRNAEATAAALRQALENPEALRRMGQDGRRLTEEGLTWDKNVERLLHLLAR